MEEYEELLRSYHTTLDTKKVSFYDHVSSPIYTVLLVAIITSQPNGSESKRNLQNDNLFGLALGGQTEPQIDAQVYASLISYACNWPFDLR